MLPLASFLLAALLGQSSAAFSDPPPCAAANVPGCLPGYVLKYNRWGLVVYMRDPNYVPPLAQAAPVALRSHPSELAAQAPTPSWVYPTTQAPAPAARRESRAAEGRGHVAVVFMPGVSAFPTYTRFDQAKASAQIALEFRGTEGGGRVRLAAEYTAFGRIGELSLKYCLFDGFFLRPFLAVGGGVASINPDPKLRAAGSGSAGIDLYLARDFFLSGEVKRRFFMAGTQGEAHGLVVSEQKQTSLLVGMGFYFF
jgi:hypothetical protein